MSIEENKTPESVDNNNETKDSKSGLLGNIDLESILGEKTFDFYIANKQKVNIIGIILSIAIVALIGYKFIWKNFFIIPKENEAIEQLWQSESKAFDEKDWKSAIYGDTSVAALYNGFKYISNEYEGYTGGDLAMYDLGISYLNFGYYDSAIIALEKVTFEDELLGTIAIGAIGDAYFQNGAISDALINYEKAYKRRDNTLTSPLYMMKAAFCLEIDKKYEDAKKLYQDIQNKYPNTLFSVNAKKRMTTLQLGGEPLYVFSEEVSK